MKKIIYSLVIGILVLSLTGCGKKLTCESTLTEAEDGIAMTAKVVVSFKNDLADKATLVSTFADEATASTYYEYMKESSDDYVLNGKTITISKDVEDDEKLSFDKTKAELEAEGYTCK